MLILPHFRHALVSFMIIISLLYHQSLFYHYPTSEVIITEYISLKVSIERETHSLAFSTPVGSNAKGDIDRRGITIDKNSGRVYIDEKETEPLTNLEYRLLYLLYERDNEIVSKNDICQLMWNENYTSQADARIEKLISRLRRKIEPDPKNPKYLVSIRGRGYRFYRSDN